jgi:hypothetical protein
MSRIFKLLTAILPNVFLRDRRNAQVRPFAILRCETNLANDVAVSEISAWRTSFEVRERYFLGMAK